MKTPNFKSGLQKIRDIKTPCLHPDHNPPSHISLPPGEYVHICPGCGEKRTFVVPNLFC